MNTNTSTSTSTRTTLKKSRLSVRISRISVRILLLAGISISISIAVASFSIVFVSTSLFETVAQHADDESLMILPTQLNTETETEASLSLSLSLSSSSTSTSNHNLLHPFPFPANKNKPYYKLWNFTTNRIDLQPHSGPPTSLEILQRVIEETNDYEEIIRMVDHSTSNSNSNSTSTAAATDAALPSCFVANLTRWWEVVQTYKDKGLTLEKRKNNHENKNKNKHKEPVNFVLNLGFPKCGTTTLRDFFACAGYKAGHSLNGNCMRKNIDQGKPPLHSKCMHHRKIECQLDITGDASGRTTTAASTTTTTTTTTTLTPNATTNNNNNDVCVYPQISFLDEFHREEPTATFVLIFRPVQDWIRSANEWLGFKSRVAPMRERWNKKCRPQQLPGLMRNRRPSQSQHSQDHDHDHDHDHDDITNDNDNANDDLTDLDLKLWWCRHVMHVREFVRQYPTHDLIELDLYDDETSGEILTALFGGNASCWGRSNVKRETKNEMKTTTTTTTTTNFNNAKKKKRSAGIDD
jgi:hypothetical protein